MTLASSRLELAVAPSRASPEGCAPPISSVKQAHPDICVLRKSPSANGDNDSSRRCQDTSRPTVQLLSTTAAVWPPVLDHGALSEDICSNHAAPKVLDTDAQAMMHMVTLLETVCLLFHAVQHCADHAHQGILHQHELLLPQY